MQDRKDITLQIADYEAGELSGLLERVSYSWHYADPAKSKFWSDLEYKVSEARRVPA